MTSIEWTGKTWNPITGCKTDVQFHPERLEHPLKWRKPRMVFVNSMSDLFHESVTDEQLDQVFAVMALTPQHTYQVLTKRPERPERMLEYFTAHSGARCRIEIDCAATRMGFSLDRTTPFPFPNVWLGVTVENQAAADQRREPLKALADQGWFTWVSHEPALEQVDFTGWEFIRWLVMGGESGPGARPFDIEWPRFVMKWAADNQVDFFLKQLGSNPSLLDSEVIASELVSEWPEDLRVRQMPSVGVQ